MWSLLYSEHAEVMSNGGHMTHVSDFLSCAALPAESAGMTAVRDDGHMSDDEGEGADDKQKDKKKKVKKKKKVCVINPETQTKKCFLNHPVMCVKTRFPVYRASKSDSTLCALIYSHTNNILALLIKT